TRTTTLRFHPRPAELTVHSAAFQFDLAPRARRTLLVTVRCALDNEAAGHADPNFFGALRRAHRRLRDASTRGASVQTSNDVVNEVLSRSLADAMMLLTDTPQGPYPYAGIPWFSTAFGRDGIITALEMLWLAPWMARGVLLFLADHQATREDPAADA